MITYRYTNEPLSLDYTDEQIRDIIQLYIQNTQRRRFTYSQICNHILDNATKEGRVGHDSNTIFLNPELKPSEMSRISVVLWDFIWNKELCVDFHQDYKSGQSQNDYAFIIIKRK